MFKNRLRYTRRVKGFTIIELMIVISIIAILAGILVPNFVRSRAKAKYTACCENLKKAGVAIQMYANDNDGYYPTNLKKLTPNYLASLPTCPAAGVVYTYGFSVHSGKKSYGLNCQTDRHKAALNTKRSIGLPGYTPERGLWLPPDD